MSSESLELAKNVAKKAKELAREREARLLATVRAEFYTQLSEVLKSGKVEASTWHVGSGDPEVDLGKSSDFYINGENGDIFFNKAGTWERFLNIKPLDGKDGAKGDKGDRGEKGATGLAGTNGRDGKDGKNGLNGKDGRDGKDGKNGKDGKDGADGSRWFTNRGKPKYDLGKPNDFYLDSNSGEYYEKIDGLNWERKGSLKGPGGASFVATGSGSSGSGEGGAVDSVNSKTGAVTLTQDDIGDGSTYKQYSATEKTKLAGVATGATANDTDANLKNRANHTGTQSVSTITGLADVATSGDYADLSNTPDLSVFDEVEQYDTSSSFPATGDVAKFYLAQDTGIMYRWTGSIYSEISASLALGETSATAYRGDRGKTAYDHSQLTSGNPHNVTKSDVGLGNAENTSDANKPVSTAQQTALNAKANASDTVNLTGNQTVAGVKTFTSAPIAPSGTSIGGVLYLTGTGFPEGVVSAPVGSIYIDKAITNGASSWIKKSGTGSTGWRVLEGDTGLRNITSLATGTPVFSGGVWVRRVNNVVTISISDFESTWSTVGWLGIIASATMAGFMTATPGGDNYNALLGSTFARMQALSNGVLRVYSSSTGTFRIHNTVSYITSNTWPTTLPGTSA